MGDYFKAGELELVCLNPVSGMKTESANEGSITLSLEYQDFSCLLTGDLEGTGEEQVEMLLNNEQYECLPEEYTVLKVAHHGSKNSSGTDFLDKIKPELSVISCGKDNRYGHPHEETLDRLQKAGSEILVTAECGAILVESGQEIVVKSWKKCCYKEHYWKAKRFQ